MIIHYVKIAVRNLTKQKGLTFINIVGLSIGIACFSLFVLYSLNELSFDRFHLNKKNIYRVYRQMEVSPGEYRGSCYLPLPLGPAIKHDLPDVKNFVRLKASWQSNFARVNNKVNSIGVSFADPALFSTFTFPLKYGNLNDLKNLHAIAVTEKAARILFSTTDVVGKTVELKLGDKFEAFVVSAVCKDIPSNSSIQFDVLANFEYFASSLAGDRANDWQSSGYQTYVELHEASTLFKNQIKLKQFYQKYHPGENPSAYYGLQPLLSVHTDTRVSGPGTTDPQNIVILLGIAFCVLLIACINFTTLAIGRSAGRAKEIGVRKVVGGSRKSLVKQFLIEAVLLSAFSTVLGLFIGKILLPLFNRLSEKDLDFSFIQFPELPWFFFLIALMVGLLAGSYPALVLSAFDPLQVLKKNLRLKGSNLFTKSLVTFQFVLSVGLIISTFIMLQQLRFMRSKDPGFNKENIVLVNAGDAEIKRIYPLFRHELMLHTCVKAVAGSEIGIGEDMGWSQTNFESDGKQKRIYEYFIDPFYLQLMNIPILAGRNFSPETPSDTVNSILINESMMRDFGWTLQNAVGQRVTGYSEKMTPIVIGVVKNFHFRPFKEKIEPQLFHQFSGYAPYMVFVRIQPGDPSKAMAVIEDAWKKCVPEIPMKYSFLNEDLDRFYKSESRWGTIIGWAGGISIFLSCLGLLGLAALSSINRTKEIGIRKVLGASVTSIAQLLSKDFIKLILIAIVLASPIAWYFMDQWLRNFAFHIGISWWIFVVSGLASVVIAMITIGTLAIQTAIADPVKNLRTE